MKREASLPEPEKLLEEKRYWNKKVFFAFIERCYDVIFADPESGLSLARNAVPLAEKLASSVTSSDEVLVAAYAVLGAAHRAIGDFAEAERAYDAAEAHSKSLPELERVDLSRRKAYLRLAQGRTDEALELIESAIVTYRLHGDLAKRDSLGRCYLTRGEVHWNCGNSSQAVLDYATALTHLDLSNSRFVHATLHNLMVALATSATPDALGKASKLLKQAETRTYYKRNRLAKYKLKWLKALICLRFGSTRQAIRFLSTARDGLSKLGAVHDFILISLDLNDAYFMEARPAWELRALAQETYELASSLSTSGEAVAALTQWRDAAEQEALTEEIVRQVRERVAALERPKA